MPKRNLIWIVAIVVAAAALLHVSRDTPAPTGAGGGGKLRPVTKVYDLIRKHYYLPLDEQELNCGAVRGMIEALDEYSRYIPPEKQQAVEDRMEGLGWGVGLSVGAVDDRLLVTRVRFGLPAHRWGVKVGDRLLAINGQAAAGLELVEAERLLAGRPRSTVELTILQPDGTQRELALTAGFSLETVEGLFRDEGGRWVHLIDSQAGIGYLRITEFAGTTREQLQDVLDQMDGLRGLVLDLRDNPGGPLLAAVEAANKFLRSGRIVTVTGPGRKLHGYDAHSEGTYSGDVPIVVLVNAGTASAAEVVAGALGHHGRAVLVGTRTCGKGWVESMIRLPDKLGWISLTTGEFLIGSTGAIARRPGQDEWGVEPHEKTVVDPSSRSALLRLRLDVELPAGRVGTTAPAGRGDAGRSPPASATQATTGTAAPVVATADTERGRIILRFLRLDTQLARGIQLLKDPRLMEDLILKRAAAEREAAASRPAQREHD